MKILTAFAAALAALAPLAPAQPLEEPLTLTRALALVEELNPELRQQRLRALEMQAAGGEVRAGMGPQLALTTAYSAQTTNLQGIGVIAPGFPSRVGPFRVFDARPRLTQTALDLSLLERWRAARARTRQAEEETEAQLELLRLAVIQLYLQTQRADSSARAAAARLATADALLEQETGRFGSGTGNKLNVARAGQQRERERAALITARRDRDTLSTLLVRTLGLEAAGPVELAALHDAGAAEFTKEPGRARFELRALDARREAATHDRRAATRERWPRLQGFADYGVLGAAPNNSLSTWTAGFQASIPLFTSGRIESAVRAARHREAQVDEERRRVEQAIAQEIAQARIEQGAARETLAAATRAAAAAAEALELARLRHDAGLATQLDVISAQGDLAQAEEDQIRARYDGLLAAARLAQARGHAAAFLDLVVEGR